MTVRDYSPRPDLTWRAIFSTLTGIDDPAEANLDWLDETVDLLDWKARDLRAAEAATIFTNEQVYLPFGQLFPALARDLNEPLCWLPFRARLTTAFAHQHHLTVGDLLPLTIMDLLDIRDVGWGSACQTVAVLANQCVAVATQLGPDPTGKLEELLAQVTDPDLVARLRSEIGRVAAGAPQPELAAVHTFEILVKARANNLAVQFNKGISLADLAAQNGTSVEWVRRTIVERSDWDFAALQPVKHKLGRRNLKAEQVKAEEKAARFQTNRTRSLPMVDALAAGKTLDQIGADHGITRERIRQLINRYSGTTVPQVLAARKVVEDAAKLVRHAQLVANVTAWSEQNPGSPISDAEALFGAPLADINTILGERRNLHTIRFGDLKKWTDAELIDQIRQFHADTGSVTGDDFDLWSKARGGATSQSVGIRFSRWTVALQKAGIAGITPVRHARTYSVNDLWAAVVEYLGTPGVKYTFGGMQKWGMQMPGRPSAALLRVRLTRSWIEMRDRASAALTYPAGCDPDWVADVTTTRDWSTFRVGGMTPAQAVGYMRLAVAALGPDLTVHLYVAWATATKHPTMRTLLNATGGTWSELVVAAGGNRPASQWHRWPVEAIVAQLVQFYAEYPDGTLDDYTVWSVGHHDRPGIGTVRRLVGNWETAKMAAQAAAAA